MTRYELILAHQACLQYMNSNFKYPLPAAKTLISMMSPATEPGRTLCKMIANAIGRAFTCEDALALAAYL